MGARKNRLNEAVLTCTHDLCFEEKIRKNIKLFPMKIISFTTFKNRCILHRHVCVMDTSDRKGINQFHKR